MAAAARGGEWGPGHPRVRDYEVIVMMAVLPPPTPTPPGDNTTVPLPPAWELMVRKTWRQNEGSYMTRASPLLL